MCKNQHKTVCANTRGIIISFRDVNKHKFVPYNKAVENKQLFGTVKYQSVFNRTQEKLYTEVVYGFEAYTYQEIKAMSIEQKNLIVQRYTRVQRIINKLKNEIYEYELMSMLKKVFHRSDAIEYMCEEDKKPMYSKMTEENIAKVLIEKHLLPKNFFQLT